VNSLNFKTTLIVFFAAAFFVLVGTGVSLPVLNNVTKVQIAEASSGADAAAEEGEEKKGGSSDSPWKPMAAAIALLGGCLGTGLAQSKIGSAGAGAIAERPETATMVIVMLAIPETIVILSFVVSAMLVMF